MLVEAASKIIDRGNVVLNEQASMLAEDFSYYLNKLPGALFNLGSTNLSCDHFENLHSCKFNVDESCIATGMEVFSQTIINYLCK
jgi:metal-dependent amidase/aminoacylase/carboxypeptidase family protein